MALDGPDAQDQDMPPEARAGLAADRITIHDAKVSRLVIDRDQVRGVELADGRILDASVVVVGPTFRARTSMLSGLGLAAVPHPSGFSDHLPVDDVGRTEVPGFYAAGNVTDPSHQVLHAAAAGSRVGAIVAADLAHVHHERRGERTVAVGHSFDHDYWERHWSARGHGDDVPPPHPYLERELSALEPGTALDAGCGLGSEAVWLADRGWQVVAADISSDALERARRRSAGHPAAERLHWLEADLTEWQPGAGFDLVITSYTHPATGQLEFYERIQHWVAPGGTFLVVGHDHGHHHSGHQQTDHDAPPEHATITAASVAAILDPDQWDIDSAYETKRLVALGDGLADLHDVVVRATRRT